MTYGKGVALVLGAGILWSAIGIFVRQIDEAQSAAVMFWRSAGLFPVLWAFLHWRSGGRVISGLRTVGLPGVIGALGLVGAYGGALYALQATTVANAVFLYSAAPFFAALLGWIALRETVSPATWAAMALAGVGIFIMIGGSLGGGRMDGNIAALISAFGFAVFSVSLRWGHTEDSLPTVLLGGILSMIAAFGLAAVLGQKMAASPHDIGVAMVLGAVILTGGMVLYTFGSKALPTAELTLISSIENILAPVWVWLFIGETASSSTLFGGAMVLIAVMGNAVAGARRQAQASAA